MIYSHVLDTFRLYSEWSCIAYQTGTLIWTWQINTGPTVDSKTLTFTVALPTDAVISRAWLSVGLGYPSGGAKYVHLNGENIPSSGEIELEGITALTTSFEANFSYKANGVVYQDTNTHTGVMTFTTPTLNIEYTSESENAPEIDPDSPGNINRGESSGRQLPRLLDANLAEVARIPAKVSLDLELDPLSSATMEIPWGMHAVNVRDFVELFDPDGSAGIYRVTKVEETVGRTVKVWLKHVFATLEDDIAVGVQAIEGTFGVVVSSLLAAQTVQRWILGDVELPDEYTVLYSAGYDTISAAITGIFNKLPVGYMWEFDTLHYPWVMHLRKLPESDLCEGRLSRNLESVKITRDDRKLCTRVYPFGAGEGDDRINLATLTGALFMDADTRDTWGTISRSFAEEDIFDALTLKDVAQLYLDRNKEPLVSVTLDAMALYQLTGETLDKFYPGRLCRLAIPDYGIVMNERVISIRYDDVYGKPDRATVTLANKARDSFDDLANLIREASASKLIGGTVSTEENKNSAGSITSASPCVHNFEITSYGNLLAAKVRYSTNPSTTCRVRVDGTTIENAPNMAQPIDILRYLSTDDSGVPTVGSHYVELSPVAASSSETFWVHSTVILKTIEKN